MAADVTRTGVVAPYNVGVSHMWYRRHLKLPSSWQNLHNAPRTLLHFGGVDWESEVWLNEVAFPVHQGGCADRHSKEFLLKTRLCCFLVLAWALLHALLSSRLCLLLPRAEGITFPVRP